MKVSNAAATGFNTVESNGKSTQLEFATRQLGMADAHKTEALREMRSIEQDLAEQKIITEVMQNIRDGKLGNPDGPVTLERMVAEYLKKHNINPVNPQVSYEQLRNIFIEVLKKQHDAVRVGAVVHLESNTVKLFENECRGKFNIPTDTVPKLDDKTGYNAEQLAEILNRLKPFSDKGDQYTVKDIDILSQALQRRFDAVGASAQQGLVKAQNAIGKSSSYLDNANNVIERANQLIKDLKKIDK